MVEICLNAWLNAIKTLTLNNAFMNLSDTPANQPRSKYNPMS